MSAPSYRLETPRPRPPPLPIRTSGLHSPLPLRQQESTHSIYNDISSNPPLSSGPTKSSPAFRSPTSPSFSPRSGIHGRGLTPPLSGHARSTTPLQPNHSDIEAFAENCRAWYFEQSDNAGRLMTHTLATLPPSQRAPFSRLQASIRSAYHASVNARRNAEFRAHLSATIPGGSLMPHSRADPGGQLAKKERLERLERFVGTWCTMGMPGTKPFFEGLWAVMRLQVIPEHLGGAGGYKIEWEIDDAVFKEAAGKDFMLEAIDVLKGVLAFEDVSSSSGSSLAGVTPYSACPPLSTIHSRSQSQPIPTASSPPPRPSTHPPITSTTQTKRPRAPSDPFLDTPALSTSYSSANTTVLKDEPLTPTTPADGEALLVSNSMSTEFSDADQYMRIWTAPDLPNPEYISLLSVFPAFITRSTLPRFPAPSQSRHLHDLEEGEESSDHSERIRFGTGTMWVGKKVRAVARRAAVDADYGKGWFWLSLPSESYEERAPWENIDLGTTTGIAIACATLLKRGFGV
ncbi:uncharacterized protein FIBRA_03189 [Fibroporia radiculosa]|uniref:Uncharacterized protein n=1 Tax=Fibroporia radiculosa TaxID=599839 RepID=J4I9G9_9APHY|nr:uncharacterized protein FIBRA_03189 [Fibroporia radiculosa]CCM01141.1 predicted protein [Fibroporia radiculosa]